MLCSVVPGMQAPGLNEGVYIADLSELLFNSSRDTAFRGFLEGLGVNSSNDEGIWTGPDGALQVLVRKGQQAAEAEAGTVFNGFDTLLFNNGGRLPFRHSFGVTR